MPIPSYRLLGLVVLLLSSLNECSAIASDGSTETEAPPVRSEQRQISDERSNNSLMSEQLDSMKQMLSYNSTHPIDLVLLAKVERLERTLEEKGFGLLESNLPGSRSHSEVSDTGDCVIQQIVKLNVAVNKLTEELEAHKATMKDQQSEIERQRAALLQTATMTGVSYIRWGRTTCAEQDSFVYKGHVATSHYTRHGGGSNVLCLHDNPQYGKVIPEVAEWAGAIYGAEYEFRRANDVFSNANHGGNSLGDFPAPCAGCYVKGRTTVMMIPARKECPDGWTKEYSGYIVSEATHDTYARHRNSYTCFDEAPENATGGTAQNQGILYPVQIMCGSLPCSKYISGWELACVVCSR